jgi:uncharacterized membrane protein
MDFLLGQKLSMIWSIFICCYFSHKVSQFKMQNSNNNKKIWSKRTFVLNIILFGIIITVVMLHYDYIQHNQVN